MTKFPIMLYNTKSTKKALVPPIPPPSSYEDAVGWSAIEAGYKTALPGQPQVHTGRLCSTTSTPK